MSSARAFFLAVNDAVAVSSMVPSLKIGRNDVTKAEAEIYAQALHTGGGDGAIGRVRRQCAQILWDLWHDPYDGKPGWML